MKTKTLVLPAISATILLGSCAGLTEEKEQSPQKPNIIYILADDLGLGDLGCYGQEIIQTPNIDRMADEGMLFTQHYSGSTVCAPSRSVLLTGQHTGHTLVRGNRETRPEGQEPLPAEAYTIAELLKEGGYVTGAFGKWGLGMNETEGSPVRQGFDEFLGFLCQRYAHRYYANYIWHNEEKLMMPGNDNTNKVTYVPDYIQTRTLDFIRENKDTTFFLFVPSVIPHAELIAPEDSFMAMYKGKFEETPWGLNSVKPYSGNDYGIPEFDPEGYCPVMEPRATIAAMISRLDHQVGEIIKLVEELGIADNTIIMFTSDNGAHTEGGADPEFFGSNGPFQGTKRDLYEGGIRTPMIAWWPGKIQAGSKTDHISAFWDVMPTFADLAGLPVPEETDGISFVPTILNAGEQAQHEYLYWEFYERGGRLAVRQGDWKLIRYNTQNEEKITTQLYNLMNDPAEENNLAEQHPEKVNELLTIMKNAHIPNEDYSLEEYAGYIYN